MQKDVLQRLNEDHQQFVKCKLRAKTCAWWPGITRQIETTFQQCYRVTLVGFIITNLEGD